MYEANTTVNTITHTYNIETQPLSSSDVAGGLVYTYDGLGRMATASNAGTTGVPEVVLTLTHNRLYERTDLAAQIGSTPDFANSYLHDKLGRISRITQTGQTSGNTVADKRADFTFGSLGYNSGISRYENLSTSNLVASTTLSYDPFARLVGQSHVKDTTPLGSYSVTYDANRRIDSMTTPDGLGEFDYDGSGQLLEADYDFQPDEEFTYDLTGNRTMTGYSTGPNNQLLTAGDLEFEYDGEGNRIKQTDTATDDYVKYTWDHRNRLTKVTFFDDTNTKTKEILYTYDTHNRRIRRQLDSNGNGTIDSAQKIVYDADWKPGLQDIVLIFDESDAIQHRFLHGPGIDQPLADEQPAKLHWLLPSQLGTITDIIEYDDGTNTTTNINHLTYTSFGQIASQTNSAHEPYYTYTAREWDGDAELYCYRARWYDPLAGRFVSEDPISYDSGDYNIFIYAKNSPLLIFDFSGLKAVRNWDGSHETFTFEAENICGICGKYKITIDFWGSGADYTISGIGRSLIGAKGMIGVKISDGHLTAQETSPKNGRSVFDNGIVKSSNNHLITILDDFLEGGFCKSLLQALESDAKSKQFEAKGEFSYYHAGHNCTHFVDKCKREYNNNYPGLPIRIPGP